MSSHQHVFQTGNTPMLSDVLAWAEATDETYDAICELRKVPARLGLVDDDLAVLSADLAHFEKKIAIASYAAVSKSTNLDAARKRGNAFHSTVLWYFRFALSSYKRFPK